MKNKAKKQMTKREVDTRPMHKNEENLKKSIKQK